tara:strand:- start:105 stop:326 length:222 start_codon:yes stop_codon:yes gene_type:complete
MIMTHHARFARSFARTVPTPEAIKSLSIGMFRCGAVRRGSRERSTCVGARDFLNSQNSVKNIRARVTRGYCAR